MNNLEVCTSFSFSFLVFAASLFVSVICKYYRCSSSNKLSCVVLIKWIWLCLWRETSQTIPDNNLKNRENWSTDSIHTFSSLFYAHFHKKFYTIECEKKETVTHTRTHTNGCFCMCAYEIYRFCSKIIFHLLSSLYLSSICSKRYRIQHLFEANVSVQNNRKERFFFRLSGKARLSKTIRVLFSPKIQ